jgi:hypothetical protein
MSVAEAQETSFEEMSDEQLDGIETNDVLSSSQEVVQEEAAVEEGVSTSEVTEAEVSQSEEKPNEVEAKDDSQDPEGDPILKKLEGMQKLLDRQGTEIGQYRKMEAILKEMQARQAPVAQEAQEDVDIYSDPKAYVRQEAQAIREEEKLAELQQQQALEGNKNLIMSKVPEFTDLVDDIAESMKGVIGDQVDNADELIASFKQNPYSENPLSLIYAAEAVKQSRKVAALEQELADAKKGPSNLVANIKKGAKLKSTVNGNASASGGDSTAVSTGDISLLSDDELDQAFNQSLNNISG